jgi:hypothetical protein
MSVTSTQVQSGCSLSKRAISKARSAESIVDATEGNGGGGVSYEEEEASIGAIRDRLIDVATRLYKSGVSDRIGVENSSLVGG